MTQILPKQWKYWVKKAGLGPEGHKGNKSRWYRRDDMLYFVGKGHHWRVNCHGQFEVSCPNSNFDKWGNSRGASVDRVPKNEKEFLELVKHLKYVVNETLGNTNV